MQQDPHCAQIIRRVAQQKIRYSILNFCSISKRGNSDRETFQRAVFQHFARNLVKEDREVEQSVKIINSFYLQEVNSTFPELASSERAALSKNYTKKFIKDIIQEGSQRQSSNSPKTIQENITKQDNSWDESDLFSTLKRILQEAEDCQEKPINKKVKIEEKEQIASQNITANIYESSSINSSTKDKDSDVFDPLKESANFGHFQYGDKPQSMIDIFRVEDEIFGTVSWRQREDGFLPEHSILSVQCIRNYSPILLVQFYEEFLQQHNKDSSNLTRTSKNIKQ